VKELIAKVMSPTTNAGIPGTSRSGYVIGVFSLLFTFVPDENVLSELGFVFGELGFVFGELRFVFTS
jgi:hypothetical protein